jgi:hypothetical protein
MSPGVLTDAEQRIQAVERQIRRHPREHAVVFDANGRVLSHTEGTENTVYIPSVISRGRVVIHNHPNGESLSRRDVRTLLSVQAEEFRVITDRYRFRLRVPRLVAWPEVEWLVNRIHYEEMERLAEQVRGSVRTADEAGRLLFHQVWERVARLLEWEYLREELDR